MAMILRRGVAISVVVFGTVMAAVSCGKSTDGTDSNTHWMDACDGDTDCGNLSCLCGVCTKKCAGASSCVALGSDAICSELAACGAGASNVCVVHDDGAGGGGNSGGSVGSGGATSSGGTTATGGVTGSGGAPNGACAPMDAKNDPSFCGNDAAVLPTLYHWNGTTCVPSTCCTGKDCTKRFETAEACDDAHAACYTEDGIERACTRDEDCLLEIRACCFCGQTTLNDVIAIRDYAQRSWVGNRCAAQTGECPPCAPIENPNLTAYCSDGVCRAVTNLP